MPDEPRKPRPVPGLNTPIFGYPLFAWVGAAIYLFILFNLFAGYL
jgi:hypothetical protein